MVTLVRIPTESIRSVKESHIQGGPAGRVLTYFWKSNGEGDPRDARN